jgi:protein-tyrosine phosphatase
MKPFILFVCTGNICRSPMAAALLSAHARACGDGDKYRIESAGTWGVNGQPASSNAQLTMQKRGLSLDGHIARTVTPELVEQADLIIVMTKSHRDALASEFPTTRRKLHLMSELGGLEYDISDPYGRSLQTYETCAQDLTMLIERGYLQIPAWLGLVQDATPSNQTQSKSH